jgi:hypothetical protein
MALTDQDSDVLWLTHVKRRYGAGLVRGIDRTLWLARSVPMAPILDAVSDEEKLAVAQPLNRALREIGDLARLPVTRRRATAKGAYRDVHVLLVNAPRAYEPPAGHPARDVLEEEYGDQVTWNRVLILAVRLQDKTVAPSLAETVTRFADTITAGESPVEAFAEDIDRVSAALSRAGLQVPSDAQMRLAENWVNLGDSPDVPVVPCAEHLHVFDSAASARAAFQAGLDDCSKWPRDGSQPVTFAAVQEFDLPFVGPLDPRALWAIHLTGREALAVSVRGRVEPGQVTSRELKRASKRYLDDIRDRANNNKSTDADQTMNAAKLENLREGYELDPRPVLTDCSVLVALPQPTDLAAHDRVQDLRLDGIQLRPMAYRQRDAWAEMQLCSRVRANPHRHDLPAEAVACAGLPSKTTVGDPAGAVVGFTLVDRQPAYLDWSEGSRRSRPGAGIVAGASGSGKTQLALSLARQTAKDAPCILIDPKSYDHPDQSLEGFVVNAGGRIFSLDRVARASGSLDPIRFSPTPEDGIPMAVSVLSQIDPFGGRLPEAETYLNSALVYGVEQGAQSTGSALRIAKDTGKFPAEYFDYIERQTANAMFSAMVGTDDDIGEAGEALASLRAGGLTLVQVGRQRLELPSPDQAGRPGLEQRIGMALVRMLVYGCTRAVAAQGGGMVLLDEAWVFLQSGLHELEKIARLARSMNTYVLLLTQKPSDASDANFDDHLSRVLVLHLDKREEAEAACKMARLDATPERIETILNVNSVQNGTNTLMYLERPDPEHPSRTVVTRGSIALYSDLDRRTVATEIYLSPAFLTLASTKPDDVRRRRAERAAALASAETRAAG